MVKVILGLLAGGAVVGAGIALAHAHEQKKTKGGTFAIMLGSQVVIPNTDEVLNALERDFGFPLESVATRYISTTKNGTLFSVSFLPSADTPTMPKPGKLGTTSNGVPYKVVSVTRAPVS